MSVLLKGTQGNFINNGPVIITEHFNVLSSQTAPYDLVLKANCQKLYYSLLYLLQDESFAQYFWHSNQLLVIEKEYNDLFKKLLGYIYSFDTLWSFFTCTLLLAPYQNLLSEQTRKNISVSLNHMKIFVSEQITLSEKEREQLLNLIAIFPD